MILEALQALDPLKQAAFELIRCWLICCYQDSKRILENFCDKSSLPRRNGGARLAAE